MRLLDAVRGGGLLVPRDILKVEGDLKEWKRKDKEARSGGGAASGASTGAGTGAKTAGGNKRKRDGEESAPTPKATAKKSKAADSSPAKKTVAKSSAKKSESAAMRR
ncbi:uncharacterized protein ACHE_30789S [Aspergillus chevalieri]|uniref:Uncharacterized protein n=1 Tax=Aspergillus chevalieri TaxID=182096 RepID=A0A7R7VLB4_ASPCH|nr:uncharacterized protein ACHE_30789S [Aspergillus chevalieri]BCR86802.1 hypothetical protein ACHE_30789S [Aspergillus chevalieri]